jgi:hypothetical protein
MAEPREVRDEELHALADFRYQLRAFLRVSEDFCKAEGVTPLQYQMLLQTRAVPGRPWVLVGELAGRLRSSPHGAVALVSLVGGARGRRALSAGTTLRARAITGAILGFWLGTTAAVLWFWTVVGVTF